MKCSMVFILLLICGRPEATEIALEFSGFHVRDFALSQSGQELYVTMESMGKGASQIIRMQLQNNQWSEPVIASFSGQFKDLEPFLHPNGLKLYFASNRNQEQTAATEQFDLWQVSRASIDEPWGQAERLNGLINTPDGNEFYPSVASNGNLYFTATKENGVGKEDIYVSRWVDGQYTAPEMLPEAINSTTYEFNAYISPDEQLLIFSSFGRKDGMGGGDLYLSRFEHGQWQPATNMGPEINSKQLDYCPFYDFDNQTIYWTSNVSELKQVDSKRRSFSEWQALYTSGKNGMGKIYHKRFDLSGEENLK